MSTTEPDINDDGGGGGDGNVGPGTGPVTTTAPSGWQSALAYTLNVTQACRLDVIVAYKQAFSSGSADWAARLLIDGVMVHDVWGRATIDSITLLGSATIAPGSHTVNVIWQAQSTVALIRPRMKLTWSYK